MLMAEIEQALDMNRLANAWAELAGAFADADAAAEAAARAWTRQRRDTFLAAAAEVDDPDDRRYAVVLQYIELKSHWIQLNTQISYQNAARGEPDAALVLRAAHCAQLLGTIECLISADDLALITRFLAAPMASAQPA